MNATSLTVLSLDIMDISGEHQVDIAHDIVKTRINKDGRVVEALKGGSGYSQNCCLTAMRKAYEDGQSLDLQGDAQRALANRAEDYCGSCYGGLPPASG